MTTLDEPLRRVLGGRTAKPLEERLGLRTVRDLLRHYPRRYANRGELTDLTQLRDGDHVTVLAEVARVNAHRRRQHKGFWLQVYVTDGRGTLVLSFFNAIKQHEARLRPGCRGLFSGKITSFHGRRQLSHPEYQLLAGDAGVGDDIEAAVQYSTELIPVYPAVDKLTSWQIAKAARVVLDTFDVEDPLPQDMRSRHGLTELADALRKIHRPGNYDEVGQARKRLKWDEAFALQITLAQRRRAAAQLPAVARPRRAGGLLDAFDERLPFELTEGQRAVGELLSGELAGEHPAYRLFQGDVGSGKTVVALRAMLQVVDAGGQAALLAPTEVLAQQHYHSIVELLGPLAAAGTLEGVGYEQRATKVALLTGSQGAAARRSALLAAASGEAGLVVGTHALLQQHVQFADLGLVVVDEQHRFGVEQRDALRERAAGRRPHVVVMTATPIPRTVAMTVFGDLDVATLDEMPSGRTRGHTFVVPAAEKPHYLQRAWERVREEAAAGRQAYVVCPRVGGQGKASDDEADLPAEDEAPDDGPRREPMAVSDVAPMLAEGPLEGLRLGVLHGRLPADEKEAVMGDFTAGKIDVLVATTVIEVGVDVPNAAVMVVLDADRFGVSQLHQLRGRVGRGTVGGLTLLVTDAAEGTPARSRVEAVAQTADGFELARVDLEQRREGDVLGAAQAGRKSSLRMLTLLRDEELINAARQEASALVERDPELTDHPLLAASVAEFLGEERAEYLEKG